MSTPKMWLVRMRFFSADGQLPFTAAVLEYFILELFRLVLHVPLEAMVEQALESAQKK